MNTHSDSLPLLAKIRPLKTCNNFQSYWPFSLLVRLRHQDGNDTSTSTSPPPTISV
jgi:hypothetical protein